MASILNTLESVWFLLIIIKIYYNLIKCYQRFQYILISILTFYWDKES